MKRIIRNRSLIFIGVMAAVALFLYLLRSDREQRQALATRQEQRSAGNEAAIPEAAEDVKARQAQFQSRYLNVRFGRNPTVMMVAVAATSEDGKMNHPITDALVKRFQNEDVELISSLFKPAFFTEGMFSRVFADSSDAINRLGLPGIVDGLLLAQEDVQYSTNASSQNAISADLRLKIASLPFVESGQQDTWTLLANGTGFDPPAARADAEQLLIKEIAADTNMSLIPLPPENRDLLP